MTETSFHFADDAGVYGFQNGLIEYYPDKCTDDLGNVCPTVSNLALNLAIDVDNGAITEAQAAEQVVESAADVGANCRFGLSAERPGESKRRCGYGVLFSMGIEG